MISCLTEAGLRFRLFRCMAGTSAVAPMLHRTADAVKAKVRQRTAKRGEAARRSIRKMLAAQTRAMAATLMGTMRSNFSMMVYSWLASGTAT